MVSPITIYFLAIAPIPVGHRVEVRTFWHSTGVFRRKREPNYDHPIITDLETRVVYSTATNYVAITMYAPGARHVIPLTPRSDLELHGCWTGVIQRCHVHWIGVGASSYPQTTLVVQPQPPTT